MKRPASKTSDVLVLTNFPRFPEQWRTSSGVSGRAIMVRTAWDYFKRSREADLVIVNCDPPLTMKLAALYLLFPLRRRPILAHDVVLRIPRNWKAKLLMPLKRFLLGRVEHFTLHFKMLDGYRQHWNIDESRASYLPFKPNIRYKLDYRVGPDGDYVLCFGRSERDYDTFFEAMQRVPEIPGAIPKPDFAQFRQHTSRFTWDPSKLPPNVRILEDDGTLPSLLRIMEKAKLVALPIVKNRIAPSGIGTYLNAMLLGKCVVISEGIAASDVLTNGEALLVPPEDPAALAETIRRVWNDDDLRLRTAERGRLYSEACGGEPELRQRVLDRAVEKLLA